MSIVPIQTTDRAKQLSEEWKHKKAELKKAEDELFAIECELYVELKDFLPEKGTAHFDTGMKIVTGMTESWDQAQLDEIYKTAPAAAMDFWPFTPTWKPAAKKVSAFMESPYAHILAPALTVKPKKPSFSFKEESDA